jgi:predicted dehydrogenase
MSEHETETNTIEPTEYMLTTVDNPFNPFTEFEEWLDYDTRMGYNTAAFLDRIAKVSNELSTPDQALAIQHAIDEIVQENVSGMWKKVSKDSF